MKKLIIYTLLAMPLLTKAQVDRTKAPEPFPAPEIKIGQPATFTLPNGLKVFVVQNTKLPRVTATLTIDVDGVVEGNKTGLTSMGGELLQHGTKTMNKAKLDEAIDFLGADINTSGTSASASSLKNNFAKAMALMADIVLRPAYSPDELEKIRKRELSEVASGKDQPEAISDNVVNRIVYGKDHPYGDIETEETVKNVKLEDIKKYFATYWKPNNAYLVFVGDITAAEAKALATKTFGLWKRGVVSKPSYSTPQPPAKTFVALVDRPASVQSLMKFVTPVQLTPGAPDAIPASVMANILGGGFSGRLFSNLREKHGFTYGAYARLSPNRLTGTFQSDASVRNEKTDSAIAEFFNEFNRLRTEPVDAGEVARMKNYMSGSFARSLENPATIANFALTIARNKLSPTYYQNYLKNLAAVTPEEVKAMADKYVLPQNMYVVIVGNATQVAPGLEKYGAVKYYDIYGNPVATPSNTRLDPSVTPASILQKAVAATASPDVMAAIKDASFTGTVSVMGRDISVDEKFIVPGTYATTVSMGGMVLQKQMLKDGAYTLMQQGQTKEASASDKEEINERSSLFDDAYLAKQTAYQFTVTGIEKVNGQDAYALQVKTPAGREYTNYYDVASGLRVKTSQEREAGPMGKMVIQSYYSDYKTYNGAQFPTHVVIDLGQMKQEITFKDVKINSGLKPEDVK